MAYEIALMLQRTNRVVALGQLAGLVEAFYRCNWLSLATFTRINFNTKSKVIIPSSISHKIQPTGEAVFVAKTLNDILGGFSSAQTVVTDVYGRIGDFTPYFKAQMLDPLGIPGFGECSFHKMPSLADRLKGDSNNDYLSLVIECSSRMSAVPHGTLISCFNTMLARSEISEALKSLCLGNIVTQCSNRRGGREIILSEYRHDVVE